MTDDNTDTIAEPTLTAGDPPPADPPPPAPEPAEPAPRMIPADVLVREVTPLRAKNRELESALDEHRRRLSEANELLSRLQRPADPNAAPAPPQPRQADPQTTQQDIDRRAAELNFQRDAQQISETAYKSFGQRWVDSVGILNSFGLNSGEFVSSVMDVVGREKTHEVMHEIAQNPEKAASLASMSPARRIAEITRISEKMAKPASATSQQTTPAATPQPATRTVSRAPEPAPRVDPSASQTVDWRSDKASDADFAKGWEENMAKRRARR